MIDETLRTRLEALNRGPIPAQASPTSGQSETVASVVKSPTMRPPSVSDVALGRAVPPRPHIPVSPSQTPPPAKAHTNKCIPGLLRSGDTVENTHGEHLRIRLPIETLWPNGPQLIAARHEFLRAQLSTSREAIEPKVVLGPEFASLVAALPDRAIGLDLETCGLAGSALFLIGLVRQIDGNPTIELLLARNYAEEAAVLATFWEIIAGHEVLLTFNGKTFDWPMVLERSVRHRLEMGRGVSSLLHIDILHHSRRRWRTHLPNCRLQTLEQHVCRRTRTDDIPGHRIPGVYADYVRTGFERDMDNVLHHNALDLVTLLDLALRLAG